jgi:hypothetical protein
MNWIKDKLIDFQLKKALSNLQEREIGMPKKPKTAGIFAATQEEFEEAKKLIRDKWGFQIRIEGGYFADPMIPSSRFLHNNSRFGAYHPTISIRCWRKNWILFWFRL